MLPSWLVRSRVAPPQHLRPLITRAKTLQLLDRASPAPIVLLTAPPGFGKSALLEQWSKSRADRGAHSAWLTLDSTDDPESTLVYLAFAFYVARLDLSDTSLLDETTPASTPRPRRLQSLVAAIERSGDPWVLAVDDLDRAPASVIREVIEPLIRFMPRTLTVALATRRADAINLSDASDRGLVMPMGAEQLRFDRDDVRAVLGNAVSAAQVNVVEQQTGGWPALVQLFRDPGSSAHREALEGGGALTAFFEARILNRLDEASRRLLLRLSLLPRFTTALVEELIGPPGSWRELESLESLGIVCRTADEDGFDLAVRPVFREYFERKYLASNAAEALDLQRRAARVYLRRGAIIDAVRSAAATGVPDFLVEIVEACDPVQLWLKHGLAALNQVLRLVPEDLARAHPSIGYAFVISWVKAGRLKDAQRLFDHLEPMTDVAALRRSEPDARVLIERALCHSMLAVYRGIPVPNDEIDELERLAEHSPAFAPALSAMAETLRSYELQHAGEFASAKEAARACIRHAGEVDSKYAAFFMYCDLGMMSGIEGNTREAFEYFDASDRECQAEVRADERLAIIRDVFRLELEHEMNPLDNRSTARLQNICVRLPRLEGWLDVFAAAFRTHSEKLFLARDLATALATLSVGMDLLREQEIDSMANVLLAQRVFLLALAGRRAEARDEFAQLESAMASDRFRDRRSWREMEAFVEASGAVDLVTGSRDSVEILSAQVARARATGNVRSELRLRRLLLALVGPDGDTDDASRIDDLETRYGLKRTAALIEARSAHTSAPGAHAEFFTDRELEILERIASGRSDKAIAIELGISAHGVRYHLKRIYAKLNVRGRTDARAKAVQLGICR